MITPFTDMALIIDRATFMFVAVISSNPFEYSTDCVAQRSAVRFVMATTLGMLDMS